MLNVVFCVAMRQGSVALMPAASLPVLTAHSERARAERDGAREMRSMLITARTPAPIRSFHRPPAGSRKKYNTIQLNAWQKATQQNRRRKIQRGNTKGKID